MIRYIVFVILLLATSIIVPLMLSVYRIEVLLSAFAFSLVMMLSIMFLASRGRQFDFCDIRKNKSFFYEAFDSLFLMIVFLISMTYLESWGVLSIAVLSFGFSYMILRGIMHISISGMLLRTYKHGAIWRLLISNLIFILPILSEMLRVIAFEGFVGDQSYWEIINQVLFVVYFIDFGYLFFSNDNRRFSDKLLSITFVKSIKMMERS
ncbi:MAG: hypothetical protein K9L66_08800 [Spirochaetaceae bacterium]|nr:hypothetical protein [Spirochaetaceae bacterium]MCF7949934.1 hypothetical protein [Spirochaetia bacterium]MCF7951609.1 hypothetical protein [Spirochaetaceae bacterium]